jgi:hypothetical protein
MHSARILDARSSIAQRGARAVASAAALCVLSALTGCGMPGAPQPPSLNLADPVANLTAVRTGDQVALSWKMPLRNTDKILIKGPVATRICRNETTPASCNSVTMLQETPGTDATFTDTLPPALASGSPRPLHYFVELVNRKGRSAGLSNGALILAGQAPAALNHFTGEIRKEGVLLHWAPAPSSPSVALRLSRRLLTPPVKSPPQGPLAAPPEPLERTLLVDPASSGRALDSDIRFGESYEYRSQLVARATVNGQPLELAGPLSAPVRVEAQDIFSPAIPQGLAAVATAGDTNNPPSIDLSWQPVTDPALAGYIVYRSENDRGWQRVSPAQPLIGPGFNDSTVQAGHTYRYAVSAIGQNGRESARSAETEETVPSP